MNVIVWRKSATVAIRSMTGSSKCMTVVGKLKFTDFTQEELMEIKTMY